MTDWPVGLSTGCFYKTSIFDCLESIRHAGFSLIEVCSFPAHLDYHDVDAVRRARDRFHHLGIDAYSFHAPFADDIDITSLDESQRHRAENEVRQAATAASILGVQHFVIHPGPEKDGFPSDQYVARMENAAAVLERIATHCRDLGLELTLENMLPHLFSGHVKHLLWILGALSSTDVGICLDTGHAFLSGDLNTVVHKLSGHLRMVHASDNNGQYDDHLPPGEGRIDWLAVVRQLSAAHFDGTLILEIADSGDDVLGRARHAGQHLRDLARKVHLENRL